MYVCLLYLHIDCCFVARIRAQKKKELELEVAQLRKQVKRKRKAALNSSGIGEFLPASSAG